MMLATGNYNANVGTNKHQSQVARQYSLHKVKNNKRKMLPCCCSSAMSKNLFIKSKWIPGTNETNQVRSCTRQ